MFNGEYVNSSEINVDITLFEAYYQKSQSISFSVGVNTSLPATIPNITVSAYNSSFYGMYQSDMEHSTMTVKINNTCVELEGTRYKYVVAEQQKGLNQLLVAFVVVVIYALRAGIFLSANKSERFEWGYSLLHTKLAVLGFMLFLNTNDRLFLSKSDDFSYVIGLFLALLLHFIYSILHLVYLVMFKAKITLIVVVLLAEIFLYGEPVYMVLSCVIILSLQTVARYRKRRDKPTRLEVNFIILFGTMLLVVIPGLVDPTVLFIVPKPNSALLLLVTSPVMVSSGLT